MRSRWGYGLAVVVMMVLGLASRAYGRQLPGFVAQHAGDALWAAMVYFGVRTLIPGERRVRSLWVALLFCYAIEASQLVHTPALDAVRSTTLGALTLGRGFLTEDLVRYTAGVLAAGMADYGWFKRSIRRR